MNFLWAQLRQILRDLKILISYPFSFRLYIWIIFCHCKDKLNSLTAHFVSHCQLLNWEILTVYCYLFIYGHPLFLGGTLVPQSGVESRPWQGKPGILTARPQGNSLRICCLYKFVNRNWKVRWLIFIFFLQVTSCLHSQNAKYHLE